MDDNVKRLVEAARELIDYWDKGWSVADQRDKIRSALAAFDSAPSPVRCWRHKDITVWPTCDRIRWTGKEMEWVGRDGKVRSSNWLVTEAEQRVASGSWVECPDAPYVKPVAEQAKAEPTPQPPAMETAEAWARRCDWLGRDDLWKEVSARDSAWQAKVDARVGGLSKAWAIEYEDMQRTIREKDAEIARLNEKLVEQEKFIKTLSEDAARRLEESRLSATPPAAGIDLELLETARGAMAAIISKHAPTRVPVSDFDGHAQEVARGAVMYARALHAALAQSGGGR